MLEKCPVTELSPLDYLVCILLRDGSALVPCDDPLVHQSTPGLYNDVNACLQKQLGGVDFRLRQVQQAGVIFLTLKVSERGTKPLISAPDARIGS